MEVTKIFSFPATQKYTQEDDGILF